MGMDWIATKNDRHILESARSTPIWWLLWTVCDLVKQFSILNFASFEKQHTFLRVSACWLRVTLEWGKRIGSAGIWRQWWIPFQIKRKERTPQHLILKKVIQQRPCTLKYIVSYDQRENIWVISWNFRNILIFSWSFVYAHMINKTRDLILLC